MRQNQQPPQSPLARRPTSARPHEWPINPFPLSLYIAPHTNFEPSFGRNENQRKKTTAGQTELCFKLGSSFRGAHFFNHVQKEAQKRPPTDTSYAQPHVSNMRAFTTNATWFKMGVPSLFLRGHTAFFRAGSGNLPSPLLANFSRALPSLPRSAFHLHLVYHFFHSSPSEALRPLREAVEIVKY